MGLPGLSAETSLYKTSRSYCAITELAAATATIFPELTIAEPFTPSLRFMDPVRKSSGASIYDPSPGPFLICGGLGEDCCRAPAASQNIAAFGPLVGCDQGLGCNITTNKCVANCGGPGQVCCDGPETRALKWTPDGGVYSPASPFLAEMCGQGACDKQSHRCFTCGMQDGGPCCPPDAAQATARCLGENLSCEFDPWGFYTSGTCRACGKQGRPPCDWGCDPPLGIRNGLCEICGGDFQPPCDSGCNPPLGIRNGLCEVCGGDFQPPCDSGCDPSLGLVDGLCRQCGNAGQIRCDFGCRGGLKLKNGLCAVCGGVGQPPCDNGCDQGTMPINGVCTLCGNDRQPPCPTTGCTYPLKIVEGLCRKCGKNLEIPCDTWCEYPLKIAKGLCQPCGESGQIPCDSSGCNPGLIAGGGKCVPPTQPPDTCAFEGEACVADFVTGMHCCQSAEPLLCVYETCKACVPHGDECKLGGPQLCCTYGDVCKWDQSSETVVCDIPDPPDNPQG